MDPGRAVRIRHRLCFEKGDYPWLPNGAERGGSLGSGHRPSTSSYADGNSLSRRNACTEGGDAPPRVAAPWASAKSLTDGSAFAAHQNQELRSFARVALLPPVQQSQQSLVQEMRQLVQLPYMRNERRRANKEIS